MAMRFDICKVIDSDYPKIKIGNYIYLSNGLAEKADTINYYLVGEGKGCDLNCIKRFGVKWSFTIGDTVDSVGSQNVCYEEARKEGRYIDVSVESVSYDSNGGVFKIIFKEKIGEDSGTIKVVIDKENSYCTYNNKHAESLYKSYNKLKWEMVLN